MLLYIGKHGAQNKKLEKRKEGGVAERYAKRYEERYEGGVAERYAEREENI